MTHIFDTQIQELEQAIAAAQELIKQKRQEKKQLENCEKAIAKTVAQIERTVNMLSPYESAIEFFEDKVKGFFSSRGESEELVTRPSKEPISNDFFVWQKTSNEAIANYFNVGAGKNQATYIGSNNKARLAELETKLINWLPGVSTSLRKAQRLPYIYELKIKRLDDDTEGWLTQLDFDRDLAPQLKSNLEDCPKDESVLKGQAFELCCPLPEVEPDPTKKPEIENTIAREKELLQLNQHDHFEKKLIEAIYPYLEVVLGDNILDSKPRYYQILGDRIENSFILARDLETGEETPINADYFKVCDLPARYRYWLDRKSERFDRTTETRLIFYFWEIKKCQTLSELEALKVENSHFSYIFEKTYTLLPQTEKDRIKTICELGKQEKEGFDPKTATKGLKVEKTKTKNGQALYVYRNERGTLKVAGIAFSRKGDAEAWGKRVKKANFLCRNYQIMPIKETPLAFDNQLGKWVLWLDSIKKKDEYKLFNLNFSSDPKYALSNLEKQVA
ncbi:MAG: hypothetical protein QNJ54_34440 [Prochloraceae cyanobacterium]|nr:hypothetical protein [Prochloraceae cyanobacterium]